MDFNLVQKLVKDRRKVSTLTVLSHRESWRSVPSSSGYCVYDKLGEADVFFGVRLVLEVQTWRAGEDGIGNIGVRHGQLFLQPGMFHLRTAVVHMVNLADLQRPDLSPLTKSLYISGGASWQPDLEWDGISSLGAS